jgi:hypothetical protein
MSLILSNMIQDNANILHLVVAATVTVCTVVRNYCVIVDRFMPFAVYSIRSSVTARGYKRTGGISGPQAHSTFSHRSLTQKRNTS